MLPIVIFHLLSLIHVITFIIFLYRFIFFLFQNYLDFPFFGCLNLVWPTVIVFLSIRPTNILSFLTIWIEKNYYYYFSVTSKRRRGLEGEELGPRMEPAILSVEVYCTAMLSLSLCPPSFLVFLIWNANSFNHYFCYRTTVVFFR